MSKPLYKSKTFWVNAATLAAGTLGYLAGHEVLQGQEELLVSLIALQGVVNIVLRLLTGEPIEGMEP